MSCASLLQNTTYERTPLMQSPHEMLSSCGECGKTATTPIRVLTGIGLSLIGLPPPRAQTAVSEDPSEV